MKKFFVMLSVLLIFASSVLAKDISFDKTNYGGTVLIWPIGVIYTGVSG